MNIKKHHQIFIISLFTTVIFFAFSTSSQGSENKTEKTLRAIVQKTNEDYQIIQLDLFMWKQPFQKNFESFREKFSNGTVVSFQNKNLAFFSLPDNSEIFLCEDSEVCLDSTKSELTILVPYFPNGKFADIYDPFGKKIFTIDLSPKATCNENDQCDRPIEDSENCPQDCKKQEPKIDPVLMESAAKNAEENTNEKKNSFSPWILIAGMAVLALGGFLGYYLYKKNKDLE